MKTRSMSVSNTAVMSVIVCPFYSVTYKLQYALLIMASRLTRQLAGQWPLYFTHVCSCPLTLFFCR